MRLIALVLTLGAAYALGTMKVLHHCLEGTQWCFYGECSSLKDYNSTLGVPHMLVDAHQGRVEGNACCSNFSEPIP